MPLSVRLRAADDYLAENMAVVTDAYRYFVGY